MMLAVAESPTWLSMEEVGPYLSAAEIRPYDEIEVLSLEADVAEFLHGDIKEVGVVVQARRPPYDFAISSASFTLKTAHGAAAPAFTFDQTKIKIAAHEVHYLLDTRPLTPASQPYQGIFSIVVDGQTHQSVIPVRIKRIVGAT